MCQKKQPNAQSMCMHLDCDADHGSVGDTVTVLELGLVGRTAFLLIRVDEWIIISNQTLGCSAMLMEAAGGSQGKLEQSA